MQRVERHIILFDGVCNLCNRTVQTIIKKDKQAVFKFASLQSAKGKELLNQFGLNANHFNSVVYIKNDHLFLKSDAVIQIARTIGRGWGLLGLLRIFPKKLRDSVYDVVAANRYRWFGKKNECMLPTSETQTRFL